MRGPTWTVLVMLALLAGCAAPPPADQAPADRGAEPSTAQQGSAAQPTPLADESFESGDTDTLDKMPPSETPPAGQGD